MSFAIVQTNVNANTITANSLIVPTTKQLKQVAMILDYSKSDDLEMLALSFDKGLSGMVIDKAREVAIVTDCAKYVATKNPSNLARRINGIIGTNSIPMMPVKAAELALYPHTVATWIRTNGKVDRAMKTQELYAARTAFLAPVFTAITTVNTVNTVEEPAKALTSA